MKPLITLLFIWHSCFLSAQSLPNSFGFANFCADNGLNYQDAFATFNNAALIKSDSITLGISAQNVFLEELYHYSASIQLPTKYFPLGIGVNHFGDQLMNETTATVALNKKLFNEVVLGANIYYSRANAQFAEAAATVYPQLSLAYKIEDNLQFGFTARNPFSQTTKRLLNRICKLIIQLASNMHQAMCFQLASKQTYGKMKA